LSIFDFNLSISVLFLAFIVRFQNFLLNLCWYSCCILLLWLSILSLICLLTLLLILLLHIVFSV